MATGIWVRLMKKTKIEQDITLPSTYEDWRDTLEEACQALDISRPIILPRHERDWLAFSQVRFLPEHFVDAFPYDRMEVEYIDPDKKKVDNPMYW